MRKPNKKIRLCLDPTHLNKWIIGPRHSAKLADDILHRLNGAKSFTVVDSTSSFFQNCVNLHHTFNFPSYLSFYIFFNFQFLLNKTHHTCLPTCAKSFSLIQHNPFKIVIFSQKMAICDGKAF